MGSLCPHRHISYAKWRLQVLQSLYRSPNECLLHQPILLSPDRANPSTRRRYYTNSGSKSGGQKNAQAEDETEFESRTTAEASRNVAGQKRSFNPYSPAGRQAIKGLLAELKIKSDAVTERSLNSEEQDDVFAPTEQGNASTIDSPVLQWMRNNRKYKPGKSSPSEHGIRSLPNNPWAKMLADPVRACQGSGARLPMDLLLDLEYVQNPKSGKVYLLPANLADLNALEARITAELSASPEPPLHPDDVEARDEEMPREEDSAEEDLLQNTPSSVPRKSFTTRSRLFANINFLHHINNNVSTAPKPLVHASKFASAPPVNESPSRELFKLIPFDPRDAILRSEHYIQNKESFDAAIRATNGKPSKPEPKSKQFLKSLHWQHDMPVRIARIMRQRILVALKALAESETSAIGDEPAPEKVPAIIKLGFPTGGTFRSDPVPRILNLAPTTKLTSSTESSEFTVGSSHATQSGLTSIQGDQATYHSLGDVQWLPGSVFLHIGPGDIASLLRPSPEDSLSMSTLPPLPSDRNSLIPPMISVMDTFRFPVFSLNRLFTHAATVTTSAEATQQSDVSQLIALLSHPAFTCHSGDGVGKDIQDGGDHLLLIRSLQGPGFAVVEEVWRLWRYLGGENMDIEFDASFDRAPQNMKIRDDDHGDDEGEGGYQSKLDLPKRGDARNKWKGKNEQVISFRRRR